MSLNPHFPILWSIHPARRGYRIKISEGLACVEYRTLWGGLGRAERKAHRLAEAAQRNVDARTPISEGVVVGDYR